jgi:23S rRNA (uracil1939-C5)-methyltransferase
VSGLSIVKLVAGGEGLGFLDGKAVFVRGVVPGERVEVRIEERHRDFDRAVLREVLEPSPHRVPPACAYAGTCGGCDWLHVSYEEQLRQKLSIISEALRRTGGIDRAGMEIEPSPAFGSRNRAQVHRGASGLGYKAVGSHRLITVDRCPIVAPSIDRLFRGTAHAPQGLDRFTAFGRDDVLAVEGTDDDRDLSVTVLGREILFSVGCFFQSNLAVLPKLVSWALEGLRGDAAADLYCGVGLFGAFLAESFSRVICVESNAMSLSYARRNVPGTSNEFYPLRVEDWIGSGAARPRLDAVIVDPPRPGLGPEVRAWLRDAAPRRIVYVSCNPVTLARDLGGLTSSGFALDDLRLFDFYPQTSHVEAAARLSWRADS